MADESDDPSSRHGKILCDTCARYVREQFKVARIWQEGHRCVVAMRFAGERTECSYNLRDMSSDDE